VVRWKRRLHFETHAVNRMRQRGISEEQVEAVVDKPDVARPSRRDGAVRLEKRLSTTKRLAVIVEETRDFVRVVTAFWM